MNNMAVRETMVGKKGPWAQRVFFKALIYILIFSIVFLGVPLPSVPRYIPEPIRESLQLAKEALDFLEIPEAQAVQVKNAYKGTTNIGAAEFFKTVWIDDGTDGTVGDPAEHASVVMTQSVAFMNLDAAVGTQLASYYGSIDFYDSKRIQVGFGETNVNRNVNWRIVEFEDGVSVQRGVTIIS